MPAKEHAKKAQDKPASPDAEKKSSSSGPPTALLVGLTHVDPKAYGGWDGSSACWGCAKDVENMKQILEAEGYQVTTLLDSEATRKAVINGLEAGAAAAGEGSTFLFYYSAHGGQVDDQPDGPDRDEDDGKDETLCLFDGDLRDDELNKVWITFPAGSVIYMLADCCHSGTNYKNLGSPQPVPVDFTRELLTDKRMKAAMLHIGGCKDTQTSGGYQNGGAFTLALLAVWDGGRYTGTWDTFHDEISFRLPESQRPQGNLVGPKKAAEALALLRPFQPIGRSRGGVRAVVRRQMRAAQMSRELSGGGGFVVEGKMSTFGGPLDFGVSPSEGLALFEKPDLQNPRHSSLFLPAQPPGTTGLARRLNPDRFYVACRWDYQRTSKAFLRDCVAIVTNVTTGKAAEARPADWGPHLDTGRAADLSPGLAASLGLDTDDICRVEILTDRSVLLAADRSFRREGSHGGSDAGASPGSRGHGTNNPPPAINRSRSSPYYSSRNGGDINGIVLHYTTGSTTEGTLSWFENNPDSLSAHYVIGRDGTTYQMVDDDHRANHCRGANRNTIGIEHVATAGQQLSGAQQEASIKLIKWLVAQYDIPKARIQGHRYADEYTGDTDCPHSLFGGQTEQAVIDWVNANI